MNTLEENKKGQENVELAEGQQILNDAENIIIKLNTEKKTNKWILILLPIFILCLLTLFFSTIFAFINMKNPNIINGVYIHGIDVSGLSIDQAREKVSTTLNEQLSKDIILNYNDYSATITSSQFNASFNIDNAVNDAYSIGRSSNIFVNNYAIINTLSSNINVHPSISYDSDLINAIVEQINTAIPGHVVQPDFYVEDTALKISSGKDGITVDNNKFLYEILHSLNSATSENITITIPIVEVTANSIDLKAIYDSIRKDPVNAYFTKDPLVVHPSANGLDFDIPFEEAQAMLTAYQDEYTIPLKVLYPEVSTNQIGTEAFPDLLSEFSTSFASSSRNRATNISLAGSKLDGVVLMPGETLSYNQTVGRRTAAAGYKSAPAYLNGEVIQSIGGGICQVSSTLYNAALYANLEIVERCNHGFKPSYVKPGLDATVSWGGPDFKFKNNRNYPIKILCSTYNRKLYIRILGLATDNDYKVVLNPVYLSTVYAQAVYQTDSSLEPGKEKVISSGSNGCKTATYKYLYDKAGNLVSKTCISRDVYNAHNKVIAVGR